MPPKPYDLPKGLEALITALPPKPTENDELAFLQADLQYAEDALEVQTNANATLKAEIQVLKDNSRIKKRVLDYAIGSLVLIPALCFAFFILGSVRTPLWENPWLVITLPAYAQAALIITPILFFAAVIRQLISSFVGGQSSGKSDDGMTDMIKVIRETLKQSGQS